MAQCSEHTSTILKTYAMHKSQYVTDAHLVLISNPKHRIALSRLRASSHNLEIERGRYTRPITKPGERLCPVCHVVDNEIHFISRFRINENLRVLLWNKITVIQPEFQQLMIMANFAIWCLIVNQGYCRGLESIYISHFMCKMKRFMDINNV